MVVKLVTTLGDGSYIVELINYRMGLVLHPCGARSRTYESALREAMFWGFPVFLRTNQFGWEAWVVPHGYLDNFEPEVLVFVRQKLLEFLASRN
jgi:hypothetical protein